jgi:hypothetical protein
MRSRAWLFVALAGAAALAACELRGTTGDLTDGGVVELLDGASAPVCTVGREWCWQSPLPEGNSLLGIWGTSPTDVWAVGDAILHWDGRAWGYVTRARAPLRAVWGSGADDVWAGGWNGTLLHWDGVTWTSRPSLSANSIQALWGSDRDHVWAMGQGAIWVHQP